LSSQHEPRIIGVVAVSRCPCDVFFCFCHSSTINTIERRATVLSTIERVAWRGKCFQPLAVLDRKCRVPARQTSRQNAVGCRPSERAGGIVTEYRLNTFQRRAGPVAAPILDHQRASGGQCFSVAFPWIGCRRPSSATSLRPENGPCADIEPWLVHCTDTVNQTSASLAGPVPLPISMSSVRRAECFRGGGFLDQVPTIQSATSRQPRRGADSMSRASVPMTVTPSSVAPGPRRAPFSMSQRCLPAAIGSAWLLDRGVRRPGQRYLASRIAVGRLDRARVAPLR